MEKTEFDPGKAWQMRLDTVRESEAYKMARAAVLAAGAKYRNASVAVMREKGGWPAIIRTEIYRATNHLPETDLGYFGSANLVWLVLVNEIADLRNEIILNAGGQ